MLFQTSLGNDVFSITAESCAAPQPLQSIGYLSTAEQQPAQCSR